MPASLLVDLSAPPKVVPPIQPQDKHLHTRKPLVTLELVDGKPHSLSIEFPDLEKLPIQFLAILSEGIAKFIRAKVSPEVKVAP